MTEHLSEFERWKTRLVERADVLGGEPTFPRTRLAVGHVGEMARRGASVAEITADFPYLTAQDIGFAKRYVLDHRR